MGDILAVPDTYIVPAAEACALFEDKSVQDLPSDLHEVLVAANVDEMGDAVDRGTALLNLKNRGYIRYDRKHKSLRECWLSCEHKPKETEDNDDKPSEKVNTTSSNYFCFRVVHVLLNHNMNSLYSPFTDH